MYLSQITCFNVANNIMTITQKNYPFFEIPVVRILKGNNLSVELVLFNTTYNGKDTSVNSPRKYKLEKKIPVSVDNGNVYVATLTQQDFPTVGNYYGFFTVQDLTTNNIVDIDSPELLIQLQEPELNMPTSINLLGTTLNYGQALEYLLSKSLTVPFPLTHNKDGKQIFELYTGYNVPFVMVDDETGGALPIGSYIEVYDKMTNRQVPVSGKWQLQLFQSNLDGTPKGFANAEPLGTGQVSYTYLSDLPRGEYYATVYAQGKKPQSIGFVFDTPECK